MEENGLTGSGILFHVVAWIRLQCWPFAGRNHVIQSNGRGLWLQNQDHGENRHILILYLKQNRCFCKFLRKKMAFKNSCAKFE